MSASPSIGTIIVAAGSGSRVDDGNPTPKQFRRLGISTVLRQSVEPFLTFGCDPVVVVVAKGAEEDAREALGDAADQVRIVPGGPSRKASAKAGLEQCDTALVMVHDAARPFVSHDLIARLVVGLGEGDGVIPALPVTDTVKRVDGTVVAETLDRSTLCAVQTPQLFVRERLLAANDAAASVASEFTDDASIMEWHGGRVSTVLGDFANIKLTTARDFATLAPSAPPDIRVGHGYDTHRTSAGDSVMLCGCLIPSPFALDGHSDADIGLHALTDALLGTCGEGDIGSHFPPTDEQWRGASSDRFLVHAAGIVRAKGGRLTCADVTIVCERPKIGPHRDAMRSRIAELLGIEMSRVSVKATTNERIGFVGRNEGLAALATVTVAFDV